MAVTFNETLNQWVDENGNPVWTASYKVNGKIVNYLVSGTDLRGLAANKPAATAVDPGTTYWSVDTDPHALAVEVSNGTVWTVI